MSQVNFERVRDDLRNDIWDLLTKYEHDYGVFLGSVSVGSILTRRVGDECEGKRVYTNLSIEVIA